MLYGADRIGEFAHLFRGRTALVTGPTGLTSQGEPTAAALARVCRLVLMMAPEHGLNGSFAAGEGFGDSRDPATGLPVVSLYGAGAGQLPEGVFAQADTFVYDMQDVGCRYYTFLSTLKQLIVGCAAHGKRLVVLDRPNPLGDRAEGPLPEPDRLSFVGCHEIPARYGMTCGEFARMVNSTASCDLSIVPCLGLRRGMTFPDWGKSWVRPSPNMPDFEAALLYPGTCLIEGTCFSEGRGTEAPFRLIGAPFAEADTLCRAFRALALPGVAAEPAEFIPTASKHAGMLCRGIRLRVTDAEALRPVALGFALIRLLVQLYPEHNVILPGTQAEPRPFLSLLTGLPPEQLAPDTDAREFLKYREPFLIYDK